MAHFDLRGTASKGVGQDRNKGTALVAVQHRLNDMAAIGTQHASIVAHGFTGRALDHHIDHAGGRLAEPGVLTVGTHGTHHVITLFRYADQTGDFLRRVLQIGIQGDHQIAADLIETRHDGGMLAVVTVQQHGNNATPRLFRRGGQHSG
ncbi:hypothetical protein D3C75_810120 [compost metagenome]